MNFQYSIIVLKEERRDYSCCKNKVNSDLIKNLAKHRKAKVLENKYEEQYIFSHSIREEKCSIQKLNAEMARSCKLGLLEAIRVAGSNPTALWRKVDIPFSIKKNNKLLFIRSGTMIWLDRCLSNKDENIFPNPKEFDPENIKAVLKSNNENISSVLGHNRYEINSFSMVNTINNPRKCPGRVFSVFMQSLLIRELYSNYKIKSKKISVRFRKYNSMPAPEAGALITINKN